MHPVMGLGWGYQNMLTLRQNGQLEILRLRSEILVSERCSTLPDLAGKLASLRLQLEPFLSASRWA